MIVETIRKHMIEVGSTTSKSNIPSYSVDVSFAGFTSLKKCSIVESSWIANYVAIFSLLRRISFLDLALAFFPFEVPSSSSFFATPCLS